MVTIKWLNLEKWVVKVGQTWSNLIDGPDITRLGEIHIQILIIRIEEYGDILVLVKFETNWMVRIHIELRNIGLDSNYTWCNSKKCYTT